MTAHCGGLSGMQSHFVWDELNKVFSTVSDEVQDDVEDVNVSIIWKLSIYIYAGLRVRMCARGKEMHVADTNIYVCSVFRRVSRGHLWTPTI